MSTHAYAAERQRQPVRRNSHKLGNERGFWQPIDRQTIKAIILAARKFEIAERKPGSRSGPLGSIAIEILEFLANLVDYRTGRLEPSIATMMSRLRRSRDAIVRALANLKQHGFLDWLRRYEPSESEGDRGPQVQQISNAYRLALPKALSHFVQRFTARLPRVPQCFAQDRQSRTEQREAMEAGLSLIDRTSAKFEDESELGAAMARFAAIIQAGKNREGA